MHRPRTMILVLLPALLIGCDAGPEEGSATTSRQATADAQRPASPGAQILERALARHLQRMEGIDNYALVQTVMGMESTAYFEREVVDGRPRFRSRLVSVGGQRVPTEPDEWEDLYDAFAAYAERTTLRATETVGGHRVHALVVDDFSRLPGIGADAEGMDDIVFSRATIYLDTDSYVLRRMEIEVPWSAMASRGRSR
jgi:hypothetical protein